MILEVRQTKKELFSAAFEILHKKEMVGNIEVNGKIGSMEAEIRINLFDNEYSLKYAGGLLKEKRLGKGYRSYRTYTINNETNHRGTVYQVDWKQKMFLTTSYYEMEYRRLCYHSYPLALSKEGGRQSVYCGNTQVGQINTPREVFDDLYNFPIYAINQKEAQMCVLICAFMYVNVCFKPGEKVTKSYAKYYRSDTKDPFLVEKYHPDFVQSIEE